MRLLTFFLSFALFGASYTASQSGNWNAPSTWGGAGVPGFGDTATIGQYTVTCPSGVTCNLGTANTASLAIGDGAHSARLAINGAFVLRGQGTLNGPARDCTNSPSVTLGTGSTLNLDENGGAASSGFVIPASTAPCVRFVIGTSGDACTWTPGSIHCPTSVASVNNGSVNGILLLDSGTGYGDSITSFNGVNIANCGVASTSVAGCYQQEMYTSQTSWAMTQVYLNGDAAFGANPNVSVGSNSTPITFNGVISSGRIQGTDIYFGAGCSAGQYTPTFVRACTGTRSIANSLLRDLAYNGVNGDLFTAGATISNSVFDDLGCDYPNLTAANVAGGSFSYVVMMADEATGQEGASAYNCIMAPRADHIYAIDTETSGVPLFLWQPANKNWGTDITDSNFIFDLQTPTNQGAGHAIEVGDDAGNDAGYAISLSYMTLLTNSTYGFSTHLALWSSTCPPSPLFSITHVLQPYAGASTVGTMYFCEGNSNFIQSPPVLTTFKGNIYTDTSQRSNPLVFGNSNAANQPANVATPTGIDYNANWNFVPFVSTPYTTACSSGCTNSGSPYAVPMTGSAPGAHDQNINPGVTNSRTAYTWAASLGQAASSTGFKQVFINGGPSTIGANIAALFYYINRGNIPVRALWNALPDGTTIGPSQPVMFPGNIRTVIQ